MPALFAHQNLDFNSSLFSNGAMFRILRKTATLGLLVASLNASAQESPAAPSEPAPVDPIAIQPPPGQIPANLIVGDDGKVFSPYALVVDKATKTLTVWAQKDGKINFVAAYPTDIGRFTGDKSKNGDFRTPEGVYFFQEKLEGAKLDFDLYGTLAFTTDYPNFFDRLDGKTGNGIWLHSIPETKTLNRGSRGCVVVRNNVIKELSRYINLRTTPIIVEDKVQFVPTDETKRVRESVLAWLEGWRSSWEGKKIDDYIKMYDESFKAQGMDREKWKSHKKFLSSKYEFIQIKLEDPTVLKHRDRYIVRVVQKYTSDMINDVGEKTLYLKADSPNHWVIVGEHFEHLSKESLNKKASL
jgi:murein L,D-transpeptidase YafK